MFFQALQSPHARFNVVQIKQGNDIVVDLVKVIEICIHHFKELTGPKVIINEDVLQVRTEFYNIVGDSVDEVMCQESEVDLLEDEVKKVFLNLLNGKSIGQDKITNEIFKKYASILKKNFTLMFK